jgi:RNA polymerase sigma factor for flagellar operon FliA
MTLSAGRGLKILERPKKVEASLWRRLKFEGDTECRQKLFARYYDFTKQVASNQYYTRPPYGLELCDYEQLAFTGLLEALDRFDPVKSVPFEAYARHRIVGSIADGALKSNENGAHFKFKRNVDRQRIRTLRSSEVVSEGDAISKLSELAVGLAIGCILDEIKMNDLENIVEPGPNAYETMSWRELKMHLIRQVSDLPKPENTVIIYHYFKGIAFVQISRLLQRSTGRISQIHKSAIKNLRTKLKDFYK